MSDTKSGDDKTLSVNTKKTLTLKRPGVEQGTVRQNFSHGRTKSVVVETEAQIRHARREAGSRARCSRRSPQPAPAPAPAKPVTQEARRSAAALRSRSGPNLVLNELSAGEIEARRRALEGSKVREVEDRQRADRRRQAPPGRRRAPQARARGIRAPSGRGGSPPAGRGRIAPPRRGRGPPPRAAADMAAPTMRRKRQARSARRGGAAAAPDRDARSCAPDAHQGRGRPPPRQADAELGHLRGGGARPLAVVDAPPPGKVQARHASGAAREGAARSGPARDDHHPGTRQPHVGARGRHREVLHEAGPDHEARRRDRRRHGGTGGVGIRPHGPPRRRIRHRGRRLQRPRTRPRICSRVRRS